MNYYLFLKSKQGDFNSTKHINNNEVVPVFDFISGEKEKSKIEAKQEKFIKNIIKHYSKSSLFYIDHYDMELDLRYSSNIHPYSKYNQLIALGYNLGLVTGLDRDIEYQNEIINHLKIKSNIPVAIRLHHDDISAPNLVIGDIKKLYLELIKYTEKIDLIIDCRIINEDIDYYFKKIKRFVGYFEKESIDCLVIITCSSIPEKINDIVKTGEAQYIVREEGILWDKIKSIDTEYISFVYGDYGVVSPDFEELDTDGPIPIVPKITYTFDEKYYLSRGYKTNLHPDGFRQYKTLANEVMAIKHHRTNFSFGEQYIFIIADKKNTKVGNPTTWITATMVQHINYITTII